MLELAILIGALSWALFSMFDRVKSWLGYQFETPCQVCLTFWITLIFTFNPLIAAGAALTKWFIEKNDSIKL
jgi:hypothetical protein